MCGLENWNHCDVEQLATIHAHITSQIQVANTQDYKMLNIKTFTFLNGIYTLCQHMLLSVEGLSTIYCLLLTSSPAEYLGTTHTTNIPLVSHSLGWYGEILELAITELLEYKVSIY